MKIEMDHKLIRLHRCFSSSFQMSIEGQSVHHDYPEQRSSSSSSSSLCVNTTRGNEEYDPFAVDDDDDTYVQDVPLKSSPRRNHHVEQLKITDYEPQQNKQESIRITNG
jgi:hypothetical protein